MGLSCFALFLAQGGCVGAVFQERHLFNMWIMICHSGDFHLSKEARTLSIFPEHVVLLLQCCTL